MVMLFKLIGILIIIYICIGLISNFILLLTCYIACLTDKYLSSEVIKEYEKTKKYKYDKSPIVLDDIVYFYKDNPLETIFFHSLMGVLLMVFALFILIFYIIRFVYVYIKVQIETNLDTSTIARYVHNFIPNTCKFFEDVWDKIKNIQIG